MPFQPTDTAPIEEVGPQDWPSGLSEIQRGDSYNREVVFSDDSRGTATVTITEILELVDEAGNPTGGYTVSYQYDDPTATAGDSL